MRKLLLLSAVAATLGASVFAQESSGAKPGPEKPAGAARTRAAAATPAAETAPSPKKRGFLQRVFTRERATPPPAAPASPPAPATPRPRKPRKPTDDEAEAKPAPGSRDSDKAETKEKPKSSGKEKPATEKSTEPEKATEPPASEKEKPAEPGTPPDGAEKKPATPAPGKKGAKGAKAATPAPEEKPLSKEQLAVKEAMAGGDAETIEKARYDEAKSRAQEDARVRELRQKADDATTEDEGRKALRAYNKALFQKMRSLEPAIKERADRMEAAVLKQLGAE